MGRKLGAAVPLFRRGLAPHVTQRGWAEAYPVPSFVLIHPTVWPPYTNVADRQTGQTGQTAMITVGGPIANGRRKYYLVQGLRTSELR